MTADRRALLLVRHTAREIADVARAKEEQTGDPYFSGARMVAEAMALSVDRQIAMLEQHETEKVN